MNRAAYDSLSPRELDCLRLVAQGYNSKDIGKRLTTGAGADQRPLTSHTVDGYIKSGMAKLGVTTGRKEAARLVSLYEDTSPRWLGDEASGVADPSLPPPSPPPAINPGQTVFPWPWRRRGEVNNELGIGTRLLWIPILTIALAIGFGMLTIGLKVLSDLAWPSPN